MGESVEGHDSVRAQGDTKVMAVSAHDAAAWLTGQPAYDTEWPECEGVCINGGCALRLDHPACCYVHPRDSNTHWDDYGRLYESKKATGEEAVAVSGFGYWRSRNWYCWKRLTHWQTHPACMHGGVFMEMTTFAAVVQGLVRALIYGALD
jgi:hypothetical protein